MLEITENGMTTFIAQSNAIERFLANKFNLFGKDDIERGKAYLNVQKNKLKKFFN